MQSADDGQDGRRIGFSSGPMDLAGIDAEAAKPMSRFGTKQHAEG
jgi:hypothetical protein